MNENDQLVLTLKSHLLVSLDLFHSFVEIYNLVAIGHQKPIPGIDLSGLVQKQLFLLLKL